MTIIEPIIEANMQNPFFFLLRSKDKFSIRKVKYIIYDQVALQNMKSCQSTTLPKSESTTRAVRKRVTVSGRRGSERERKMSIEAESPRVPT